MRWAPARMAACAEAIESTHTSTITRCSSGCDWDTESAGAGEEEEGRGGEGEDDGTEAEAVDRGLLLDWATDTRICLGEGELLDERELPAAAAVELAPPGTPASAGPRITTEEEDAKDTPPPGTVAGTDMGTDTEMDACAGAPECAAMSRRGLGLVNWP